MDFKVETYQDLDREKTLKTLDTVVKDPLMQTTDMLMVFIMSHGEKDVIICRDGKYLDTELILSKFTCKELKDKPKFIAFQACRGGNIDVGISRQLMSDSSKPQSGVKPTTDPIWKDMLISYSSIPGYESYRDSEYGSWFVESLVRVFMDYACEKDLQLMLRDVRYVMNEIPHEKGYKQSIEVSSRGFDRCLFFNPGLNNMDNSDKYTNITGKQRTHKLETEVSYPNMTYTDLEKNIHTPAWTNTDHNLDTSVRNPETDYKSKKDIRIPSLSNTDYNLENNSYKVEKIETGSLVLCLQYDEEKIVAGLYNGEIKIYNKVTLKLEHVIQAHSNTVNCLQFNKNMLLSGSDNKSVKIYSSENYQLLNTLILDSIVMCLICDFKDMIVTGTNAGQLYVWKVNSPTDIVRTKLIHSGGEYKCVDFNDTHIVNGCNKYIQVWSTRSLGTNTMYSVYKYINK